MNKVLVLFTILIALFCMASRAATLQWEQTNGPGGGTIHALAAKGNTIFAGTDSGVSLSTNSGTTWTKVDTSFVPSIAVYSFFMIGGATFTGTSQNGIYLSNNNGTIWTAVNKGLPANSTVYSFAASGDTIFTGTDNGVYVSTDSGVSWTADTIGMGKKRVYSFAVSGGTIVAGTENLMYIFGANGKKWTPDTPAISAELIAVCGDTLVASGYRKGIYRSIDHGKSWSPFATNLPSNTGISSFAVNGDTLFASAGAYVYMSSNSGTNWTPINNGIPEEASINSLAVSNNVLFAGTFGMGVWRRPPLQNAGIGNDKLYPLTLHEDDLAIRFRKAYNEPVTVEFTLARLEAINITACDLSGRAIASLAAGTFGPGLHSLPWDTRNLSQGCYIVMMQAGPASISKRVSVLR